LQHILETAGFISQQCQRSEQADILPLCEYSTQAEPHYVTKKPEDDLLRSKHVVL